MPDEAAKNDISSISSRSILRLIQIIQTFRAVAVCWLPFAVTLSTSRTTGERGREQKNSGKEASLMRKHKKLSRGSIRVHSNLEAESLR